MPKARKTNLSAQQRSTIIELNRSHDAQHKCITAYHD